MKYAEIYFKNQISDRIQSGIKIEKRVRKYKISWDFRTYKYDLFRIEINSFRLDRFDRNFLSVFRFISNRLFSTSAKVWRYSTRSELGSARSTRLWRSRSSVQLRPHISKIEAASSSWEHTHHKLEQPQAARNIYITDLNNFKQLEI
jgi:hypothetical protein